MASFTSSDHDHDDDDSGRSPHSPHQFHSGESYDDSYKEFIQEEGDDTELTGQGGNNGVISTRACDQCRKRRSKCNRHGPCSVCVDRGESALCSYTSRAKKRGPRGGWAQQRTGHEIVIRDEPAIGDLLVVRMTSQINKNLEKDPDQEGKTCFQYGLDSSPASRKYVNVGLEGTLFGMYGAQDLDPEHPTTAAMLNTPWIRDLNKDFQKILDKANLARQKHIKTNGSPYDSPNPLALHEYNLRKEKEETAKSNVKPEADEPQTGPAHRPSRSSKNSSIKASPKSALTKRTRRSTRRSSGEEKTAKQQVIDILHELTYSSGIQRRSQRNSPASFRYPAASGSVSSAVPTGSSPSSSEQESDSLVHLMADASLITPTQASFRAGPQAIPSRMFGTPQLYQPLPMADLMPPRNQNFDPQVRQIHHQIPTEQMRNPQSSQQFEQSIKTEFWTALTHIPAEGTTEMTPSTQTGSAGSTEFVEPSTYSLDTHDWAGLLPVTQAADDQSGAHQVGEGQVDQGLYEALYTYYPTGPYDNPNNDFS